VPAVLAAAWIALPGAAPGNVSPPVPGGVGG